VDTARRQAVEQGHALAVEVKVLMLHGLLHLAGYDHEIDDGEMARREQVLRERLGLPLGLIERSGQGRASRKAGPSTARFTRVTRYAQADKSKQDDKSDQDDKSEQTQMRVLPAARRSGPAQRQDGSREGRA
jgi:hypothetical protein